MGKEKSLKNKDDKKKKKESESLKTLQAEQKLPSSPKSKSLISLKKIQKQLDKIVIQRESDKTLLSELKKNTLTISKEIKKTESQLSKNPLNKDLQQIKKEFDKQTTQFCKKTDQLTKEIAQLKELEKRVDTKIQTIEKNNVPANKALKNKNNKLLLKKINRFEEQLNQFSDTLINPEYLTDDFSRQLKKLSKAIKQSKANQQTHDTQIKLLQTDSSNVRQLLRQNSDNVQVISKSHQQDIESHQQVIESHQQEIDNNRHSIDDHQDDINHLQQEIKRLQENSVSNQQNIKKQQENIKSIDEELISLIPRLENIDKQNIALNNQDNGVSNISQQSTELLKQELSAQIAEQSQTTLTSANKTNQQQISEQLAQQKQSFTQQIEQQDKQQSEQLKQLENKVSSIEDAQQKLLAPLEVQLKELEDNIQSLQQEHTTQAATISGDAENFSDFNSKINIFNEKLQQSQEELKNHVEQIRKSDNHENLQQFNQLDNNLESLSQQFSIVSEQSTSMLNLLNTLQEQQNTASGQNDEVAKQFLTQQQQLEDHDAQLNQLIPILAKIDSNEQQLIQHSDTLEQLESGQRKLAQHEDKIQTNLVKLVQQVDKSHSFTQKNLTKINSKQQSQQDSLEKIDSTITTRSQLFTIGLITILVVSTVLFYHQDSVNQTILDNKINKQTLITQLKTTLDKENNRRIDRLAKQNTQIINQQFERIENTINTINKQSDQYVSQGDWQKQHQQLQNKMTQTHTEQQNFKQIIAEFSNTISSMELQIQQLQNISSQAAIITGTEAINHSVYTIQLLGALNKESVLYFSKQHNLSETSKIIKTEYQNKPWYILVQGNYRSFSKAQKDLQQLPEALKKNNPWIKKLP
ncbi:MAG: hypothetical protein KZQ64_03170 [gamma proteobacterium symbiont of Bathyaustriella thionipta]|nr:hypothetical protein [gamma proteobacterium symbiont of Bathyaustriella thionipta]MCU7948883.1 hypothetical protein [gamma proteobacterium symbiont of Bathyaustriella thionipta]MCU7952385.1 hypothetical protein [gamma proteobacterium symbiont of Bathyaustriella thionipta]MCU7955340.1 hypothetical protein [gamma proteobacterium symbiont of Bathyaustriella thionipta]MCU7966112.1 hypothetical protein [gamma proteobacterium symbiont of Bathyaustriella thionipta]